MRQILKVQNLNVGFDGQIIIENLSFDLNQGEILAVIGPNGSGKTVLLKTLLGLIPYQGRRDWQGQVRLGYVPQKVEADTHLPLNLHNLIQAKAGILKTSVKEINSVLQKVGINKGILETPVGHLSGGQFQKALIAMALLGNPDVILFDEPTASLDQLTEEHIYELIHQLQEKEKITIILVSHDLNVIYRYADRVLCLNKKGICFGTPAETLKPEILGELYGSPLKYYEHRH